MIPGVKLIPVVLCVLVASAACGVLDPRLPAVPPPPGIKPGLVLVELPQGVIDRVGQDSVRIHRDNELPGLSQSNSETVRRILARQVTVGMSMQEVIWTFEGHPTRVRYLGPPGGQIMLWEPDRYFVRFDGTGRASSAGRY